MRIGVVVPMSLSDGTGRVPSWREVLAFTERAEALGLQSVWVCDHFISSPPGRPVEGIHEGWTILSALAASTSRVELGQLVMCASFRNPALLAKMAATADAVSGGRLILGLGAGSYDPEYEAFGYPTDHRVGRFEEALQIIGPLLRGESVAFAGRYHQVSDAMLLPPPDRPIPILVAAKGPRMLRLTARYADAWNTACSVIRTIGSTSDWPTSRRPLTPKAETRPRFDGRSACTSWTQTWRPRTTAMTWPLKDPSTSLRA
jgi:alkanesulfonate monooxygenase SsuD/methylene tetrahydromethanopterin reductase-like flavin-dependent oxidoreductase (luciferase family)